MKERGLWLTEWALLLGGIGALSAPDKITWYAGIGLICLIAAFGLRWLRTGKLLPRTGMEAPLILFLASAAFAVWVAYNREVAMLQFLRFLAAGVVFYTVVSTVKNRLFLLAWAFLLAAAGLAIYWTAQTDFLTQPDKVPGVNELGVALNRFLPSLPDLSIHPNVAAGLLAVALPFGIALICYPFMNRSPRSIPLIILAGVLTLVVVMGLLLTGGRGGWLAVFGTGILWGLVAIQRRWFLGAKKQTAFWLAIALVSFLILVALQLTGSIDRLVGQVPDPTGSLQSRTTLWKQGLLLIRDYPFTGSGLMTFWMVHGTYGLLINTPFIAHVHNSFLEVWIEQGIVGVIALILSACVILKWAWRALSMKKVSIWAWVGLGAVSIAVFHGLIDVIFYIERTFPLVGFLIGYAWHVNTTDAGLSTEEVPQTSTGLTKIMQWVLLMSVVLVILIGAFISLDWLKSTWYANWGAVLETQIELSKYDPVKFDQKSIHQVRQETDLTAATASFERALLIDPGQRTALQRLAQIANSRSDFEKSLIYTQSLVDSGYDDEVTHLLYGDALLATGQVKQAVEVLQGMPWAVSRLLYQAWYRFWLNEDYQRATNFWSAALLLDPGNETANEWQQKALEKIK